MHGDRVFGLDLVRFVAVSLVLAAHAADAFFPVCQSPRTLETLGVCGVELFFVLSGFLIGGIIIDTLARDPRWLANFWLRRWMRTLPSYFLFLVVNVLLIATLAVGVLAAVNVLAFFPAMLAARSRPAQLLRAE